MKSGSNLNAILTNEGKYSTIQNSANQVYLKTIILASLMEFCGKMWEKIGFVGVNYAFKFLKLKNMLKVQK